MLFYSSFKKWYTNTNKKLGSKCVKSNFNKIQKAMGTRLGFVLTLLILYWLKTLLAYTVDFNLDIQLGKLQGNYLAFIAFFTPPSSRTTPASSSPLCSINQDFL